MTMQVFNLNVIHPSWMECIERGLAQINTTYLQALNNSQEWLPGPDKIFNAFSLPLTEVKYVLFGESPYPRKQSANGYAFWDASVKELWSDTGLSKKVNRATSLRNLIKMLLIAEGALDVHDASQTAITKIDKRKFVQTSDELFSNFLKQGFLLMNTTPVLYQSSPLKDAREWRPFIKELLQCLAEKRPQTQFIFLGRVANSIDPLISHLNLKRFYAEHPYNLSFPSNKKVLSFFRPIHLIMNNS